MPSLWESIQNSIKEGVQFAADKTEEMTRIGKIKYEIFTIKRSIEHAFTDLGGKYYHWCQEHADHSTTGEPEIDHIMDHIRDLEKQLLAKQEDLDAVAQAAASNAKSEAASADATPPSTPENTDGTGTTDS